jgi:hypothetical protein
MRPAGCLPCYNVLKFVTERQTDTHGRAHEVLFAFFNALARKRKDYTHTHTHRQDKAFVLELQ